MVKWKIPWMKKPWIWVWTCAAVFVICLTTIIIFSAGNDNDIETIPDRTVNIFLNAGNIQTTSEKMDGYGFYTSTGKIVVSAGKRGGFRGQLTLIGENVEKVVHMDGVMNSYVFSELDTEQAYSFVGEGLDDCVITVGERVSKSDVPLYMTMPIDLNLGEFTTTADDIYKYSFYTNSSKIYVYVKDYESFDGKTLLWSTMNGGDYVRSCDVDIVSDSCEFSKLRSSVRYQISCEDLDGSEIVVSVE